MLPVDEHDDLVVHRFDRIEDRPSGAEEMDFAQMMLEQLKTSGVQQAHKEDRIYFSSIVGWPGKLICAEGRYLEAGDVAEGGDADTRDGIERRAGIFVGPDGIACWFIDTGYNEESFFVRHAYFLGASDPCKALKTTLKAEIDEGAWSSLYSDTSRPFPKPSTGRIAVKAIHHLGDEVMKVFAV